jgi:hypothetical protein
VDYQWENNAPIDPESIKYVFEMVQNQLRDYGVKTVDFKEFTLRTPRTEEGKKFSTVLQQFVYEQLDYKLSASVLENIGNQVSGAMVTQNTPLLLRIVDDFNWKSGEFGDSGSCFWGGRDFSRTVIKDNGGRAIQVRHNKKGIARAWIGKSDEGVPVLFNAYGANLSSMAKMLANASGGFASKINIPNNISELYINSKEAWAIFPEKPKGVKTWTFNWKLFSECPICNTVSDRQNDNAPYHGSEKLTPSKRLSRLCQECSKVHIECQFCGAGVKRTALKKFVVPNADVKNDFFQCPSCSELIRASCPHCDDLIDTSKFKEENNYLVHIKCVVGK